MTRKEKAKIEKALETWAEESNEARKRYEKAMRKRNKYIEKQLAAVKISVTLSENDYELIINIVGANILKCRTCKKDFIQHTTYKLRTCPKCLDSYNRSMTPRELR